MNHQGSLFSPTDTFHFFMMPVFLWILLESDSYWILSIRKRSMQCLFNPVLVTPYKPPDLVEAVYDGHNYVMKKRVDIWIWVDVIPVEFGTLTQIFYLKMWFFSL